jgi:hypothetical protein
MNPVRLSRDKEAGISNHVRGPKGKGSNGANGEKSERG